MAAAGDGHSRLVFWLKIVLPLIALAILSTLFLVSRNIGGDGTVPFSDVDLDALARDPQLSAPEYSAMTKDGAALTVQSDLARPTAAGVVATAIVARYEAQGGQTIDLSAAEGSFDEVAGTLSMSGGVLVETSAGYRLETGDLTGRLDRTQLSAPGAVVAEAPFGRIEAGAMQLDRADGNSGDSILVFKNRVRLVYDPKS
jgi:lipopolysaccharide export system protein LptC